MTSLAVHENPMGTRSGARGAAAAKSARTEPPTRQEFEMIKSLVKRQEERWQRKFESQEKRIKSLVKRLQKVEGRGGGVAAAADLSIDDADPEQRRKKQERTNPLEDEDVWETHYSEEHGSVYFWNKLTRTTSWKKE